MNQSNKSNQIKCWFLRRGENRSTRRKSSHSRVENQQTQSTYDAGSRNRTWDTLVDGERSHHFANPAPLYTQIESLKLCTIISVVNIQCSGHLSLDLIMKGNYGRLNSDGIKQVILQGRQNGLLH